MKCGYCKETITMAPQTFSGIKEKFCQSCWGKIYTVWNAHNILKEEPDLLEWVLEIK